MPQEVIEAGIILSGEDADSRKVDEAIKRVGIEPEKILGGKDGRIAIFCRPWQVEIFLKAFEDA